MERILIAVNNKTNSRLLADLLKNHYNIEIYDKNTKISREVDLILVDGRTLSCFRQKNEAMKAGDIFLPIVLVTSKKGVSLITKQLWQMIDELITTPVARMELFARVEVLLRARRQSIVLSHQNALLKGTNTALESKSGRLIDLVANVSHELRTPLAVILTGIDFLSDHMSGHIKYPEVFRQTLETTKRNGYRLMRVVNNLLDFSKIDSGNMGLHLRNVDLALFLHEIVDTVKSFAAKKGIAITFISQTRLKSIAVDEEKLDRIMINLLSNAIKYTPCDGRVTVWLCDSSDDGKILITVEDNGIGIAADKHHIIFHRFVQADETPTKRTEGCGLGLSLVRSLVELHEGRIWLESRPGLGTKFCFELPARTLPDSLPCFGSNVKESIYYELSDI